MKKIILLITVLISTTVVNAQILCTTQPSSWNSVKMVINDGENIYEFFKRGPGRNFYAAKYSVVESSGSHYKKNFVLQKIEDNSTWEAMPDRLVLTRMLSKVLYNNYYLDGLGGETIVFQPQDCSTI